MLDTFKSTYTPPILHGQTGILPFSAYIKQCRDIIQSRRPDLQQANPKADIILNANSPFDLPVSNNKDYGVLLIHGLLDSPFSYHDIAPRLQAEHIPSRSVLLPGHGTTPSDLLAVTYEDWLQTVRYGIDSLKQEVEHVFLIGYSTGAALAAFAASQDPSIAGVILLAPAISLKGIVTFMVKLYALSKLGRTDKTWMFQETEIDYTKYTSVAFNPVHQVDALGAKVREMTAQLRCPMFMIMSQEDETISSHCAIQYFIEHKNPDSRLLLYTGTHKQFTDARIIVKQVDYPDLHIQHLSHIGLPFAPNNMHYGQAGDFIHASHRNKKDVCYGAYNHLQEDATKWLHALHMLQYKRETLTYNPDFDFMTTQIIKFLAQQTANKTSS